MLTLIIRGKNVTPSDAVLVLTAGEAAVVAFVLLAAHMLRDVGRAARDVDGTDKAKEVLVRIYDDVRRARNVLWGHLWQRAQRRWKHNGLVVGYGLEAAPDWAVGCTHGGFFSERDVRCVDGVWFAGRFVKG